MSTTEPADTPAQAAARAALREAITRARAARAEHRAAQHRFDVAGRELKDAARAARAAGLRVDAQQAWTAVLFLGEDPEGMHEPAFQSPEEERAWREDRLLRFASAAADMARELRGGEPKLAETLRAAAEGALQAVRPEQESAG